MSAEDLRRAATTLREAAQAATPGPWGSGGRGVATDYWDDREEFVIADTHVASDIPLRENDGARWMAEMRRGTADARLIALLGPDFALAVADWLDVAAAEAGVGNTHALVRLADAAAALITNPTSSGALLPRGTGSGPVTGKKPG